MKDSTRYFLLAIIGVLILLVIGIQAAYSFLGPGILEGGASSDVYVNSCAQIKFDDTKGKSITLSNAYPMAHALGLQTNPYKFGINSTCDGDYSYNVYLVSYTNSSVTKVLDDINIHIAVQDIASNSIIKDVALKDDTNIIQEFSNDEMNQINKQINGTAKGIYKIAEGTVNKTTKKEYNLYLWVDESVSDIATMNETFNASIIIKNK